MKKKSLAFLKELLDTISPSGFEMDASRVWRKHAESFSDSVHVDTHGNSFATINEGKKPHVMLCGHIDEIGLMITHIDDDGFMYINAIGGWDSQVLVGQRVVFKGRKGVVVGVVGKKPIHQLRGDEKKTATKIEDIWLDMGFKNRKDAESHIRIGDFGVLDQGVKEFRNNKIVSRGIDDKIGAFVVLEALHQLAGKKSVGQVTAVASAQEEIGGHGAVVGTYGLNPDVGFNVDVGHATDHPKSDKTQIGDHKLGSGPILTRGSSVNPVLFELLVEVAEGEEIPYTLKCAPRKTSTDADSINVSRSGVPTALISVPNRYMHSPNEMIDVGDVDDVISLISKTVLKIDERTDFTPR